VTRPTDLDAPSWELLCRGPLTIWLALSVVDSAVDSPAGESAAFEAGIGRARERCDGDEFALAWLREARAPTAAQRRGVASADLEELVRRLEQIRQVLDQQCTADEASRLKRLLIVIGTNVARAANESVAGSRVAISQPEEQFLYRARRALGLLPPR
jgi:hypothetical protein